METETKAQNVGRKISTITPCENRPNQIDDKSIHHLVSKSHLGIKSGIVQLIPRNSR